jgi:hypothetical protein
VKSYVITLGRTPDRHAAFSAAWNAPFPCERVDGVDGARVVIPGVWRHESGNYGLWLTYLLLIGEAVRRGEREPVAVFEDDAVFADGWWEYTAEAVAEAPPGWWTICLGPHTGDPRYPPPDPVTPRLARLSHAWRTHAVVYNPTALDHLLGWVVSLPWPIDQIWCEAMRRGVPHFYCTRTFLVGTRAGASVITGKEWGVFEGPFGLGGPVHDSARS